MEAAKIVDNIYRISANIETADLFEGIWPIPDGVSLNSYLLTGEKIVLIDLVKDWDGAPVKMKDQLSSIPVSFENIDYLVMNHMEPDHTGWLADFVALNPKVMIYATKKALPLIEGFYGISENLHAIESGETLDIGKGMVLRFEEIPNVHWPETMISYEQSSGVLFSCDAFGSYGSVRDAIFDDQLSKKEYDFFYGESLRYYANIVSTFSVFVERAIKKLEGLPINVVAPSHGIIFRKNPGDIIGRYARFASYMNGPAEKEITVIWSSMYGNTEQLLGSVLKGIESEGVPVTVHRVPQEHVSYVLASAWKSAGLVFGMPTYEYRMFPPMAHVIDIFDRSHVWNKKVFRFGSFGWSGGAQKQFDELTEDLKWECLGAVEFQGAPKEGDKKLAFERGRELARKIKEI
ncbi:MAG: FprA family A-type flavoprotein [Spirochaetales bacterium]|nr:FprA family A-type flavoprotein [Spirochaetales bacterium]